MTMENQFANEHGAETRAERETQAETAATHVIAGLSKQHDALSADYKAAQQTLRLIRRANTRVLCSLRSEIAVLVHAAAKDLAAERRARQRAAAIRDALADSDARTAALADDLRRARAGVSSAAPDHDDDHPDAAAAAVLPARRAELAALKDTLRGAEKAAAKAVGMMAKAVTVASAEKSALSKILEDRQKELRAMEAVVLKLSTVELARVEALIDSAWAKQSLTKEESDKAARAREAQLVEKRNALEAVRIACEEIHARREDLVRTINETRMKNDKICEELMLMEDETLKSDLAKQVGGKLKRRTKFRHPIDESFPISLWFSDDEQ
ncbi:hypothetical protein HDU83_005136 [Entophlyctis luteolus]|nr:hypothetical protein HDU83_005136 [Entophlyctis luteolus]